KAEASQQYVLGYELMNEPWPGTDWAPCLTGCPTIEAARLLPFQRRMTKAIRAVDRSHLIFSEPFTLFNFGLSDTIVPAHGASSVLSFHMYTASPNDEPALVLHALAAAQRSKVPLLATEYGAITDPASNTRMAS